MADDTDDDARLFSALRELQSLSRPPAPPVSWPPWDRIRDALPPDCALPSQTVHVLVDLELDRCMSKSSRKRMVGGLPRSATCPVSWSME